jgi:hypothetical protein
MVISRALLMLESPFRRAIRYAAPEHRKKEVGKSGSRVKAKKAERVTREVNTITTAVSANSFLSNTTIDSLYEAAPRRRR